MQKILNKIKEKKNSPYMYVEGKEKTNLQTMVTSTEQRNLRRI